jgi:hypothetical protein
MEPKKLYRSVINAVAIIIMLLLGLFAYENLNNVPQSSEQLNLKQDNNLRQKDDTAMKARKIAETIWCENRTSRKSMDLVMSVIYNRAKEKTLDGLYQAATKNKQFSCLNTEEIMSSQTVRQRDKEMLAWAHQIVWRFQMGNFKPSIPAKFYYAPKKVSQPEYLKDKKLLLAFEGHHFY